MTMTEQQIDQTLKEFITFTMNNINLIYTITGGDNKEQIQQMSDLLNAQKQLFLMKNMEKYQL